MRRYDLALKHLESFTYEWIKENHDNLPEEVVRYFLLKSYIEERAMPEGTNEKQ